MAPIAVHREVCVGMCVASFHQQSATVFVSPALGLTEHTPPSHSRIQLIQLAVVLIGLTHDPPGVTPIRELEITFGTEKLRHGVSYRT